jgi:hypothetical protein
MWIFPLKAYDLLRQLSKPITYTFCSEIKRLMNYRAINTLWLTKNDVEEQYVCDHKRECKVEQRTEERLVGRRRQW